jgi:hypothetical protein
MSFLINLYPQYKNKGSIQSVKTVKIAPDFSGLAFALNIKPNKM